MNENRIKELYEAEINNSAPDFDKLWEKIDNNLTVKENITPKISITPKKSNAKVIKTFVTLAAGLALVAFIPSLFSSNQVSTDMSEAAEDITNNISADKVEDNDDDFEFEAVEDSAVMEEAASDSESENGDKETEILSYVDLSFNSYSETVYTCTGAPYGGDYFVEEEILSDADYIVSAVVKSASLSNDGSAILYELEASVSYPEKITGTITVESCSAYTMKRGREYLLPIAETTDGYHTVYDKIPQIEFTADGGLVYYNGWSSLDTDTSQSITYSKKTVDDFFYDRMRFSYSGDYSAMIQKFYDAKEL